MGKAEAKAADKALKHTNDKSTLDGGACNRSETVQKKLLILVFKWQVVQYLLQQLPAHCEKVKHHIEHDDCAKQGIDSQFCS